MQIDALLEEGDNAACEEPVLAEGFAEKYKVDGKMAKQYTTALQTARLWALDAAEHFRDELSARAPVVASTWFGASNDTRFLAGLPRHFQEVAASLEFAVLHVGSGEYCRSTMAYVVKGYDEKRRVHTEREEREKKFELYRLDKRPSPSPRSRPVIHICPGGNDLVRKISIKGQNDICLDTDARFCSTMVSIGVFLHEATHLEGPADAGEKLRPPLSGTHVEKALALARKNPVIARDSADNYRMAAIHAAIIKQNRVGGPEQWKLASLASKGLVGGSLRG